MYWPKSSDTAEVKIAQETDEHRQSIRSLLDRMGLYGYRNERGCRFSSTVFGRLLEGLCGSGSYNKRIPEFILGLSPDQLQILLEVLLAGDGNDWNTYYTASDRLATDVLRLCIEVGVKPRYSYRDGIWDIYVRQGNDGFHSREHVTRFDANETLYRATVADYNVVLAGREVSMGRGSKVF